MNAAVGTRFTDGLFLLLGVLSIFVAAFSLVVQRNYKRMLAYSSIEHTGLICVGLALGPLGTFAAMLHLLNHALAKSMMFFLAGRVLHRYRTTEIDGVSGLLTTMPWTGGLFAAGMLAVIGLPPFGLFISEFALFRAGFAAGRPWLDGARAGAARGGLHLDDRTHEPDALRRARRPAPPWARAVPGPWSRSACAWRRSWCSGSRCRRRSRRCCSGSWRSPDDDDPPARAGRGAGRADVGDRRARGAGPRAPLLGPSGRRAGAGRASARAVRGRARIHGRRRPASRRGRVRGALPVHAHPGELVPPRHGGGTGRHARRSARWRRFTIPPRDSSGRSTICSGSPPRGTPIPGPSSATASGRPTTSRCARTRSRASSPTTGAPFPSPRSAGRACTRFRSGPCTPGSSSRGTSASASWARRSST